MRSKRSIGLAFWVMVAALAVTPPAVGAEVIDTPLRKDFPDPSDNPALQQWREGRTWRYSTEYLFGTTRGLGDYNIPVFCERAAWIVTVPFDIANLPFAALAGLFGD